MFDDQANNFVTHLKRQTSKQRVHWLRYPSAYPFQNNNYLNMFLLSESLNGKTIDPANSYFAQNRAGSVFAFTFKDQQQNSFQTVCVQQNFSDSITPLNKYDMTSSLFDEINRYIEWYECQPDSLYNFFQTFC